jgi:hypothetical protein
MVYLGPIEMRHLRVKNPASRLAPAGAVSAYAKEAQEMVIGNATEERVYAPNGVERRKSRQDRRNDPRDPMLETRAGRDRRKAKSINVSI